MTPESAPELAPDRGWIARLGGEQVLLFLLAMVGLLCLLPMIAAPLDWQAQAALGLTLIVVATLANGITRSLWFTHFLMALSLFAMARYAWWRTTQSLGLNVAGEHWYDLVPRLLLYAAELYAWVVLVLGFLQTAMPLKRKPVPLPDDVDQWPGIDVFIPTYDEPLEVVRPTVLAALQMDWPRERLHVWLLDDGTRDDFRRFAEEVGAGYIIRSEHRHAKAGNLNHALGLTGQPFVAFFDSDHVPTRSFLQVTLGSFLQDAKLGLVQTPHHFYSPDPFERNLRVFKEVPNEGELFYGVVQDGNDLWDATFFCGSCAVMRREALDSIGGIAIGTVTEDAATSLKMQRVGWRSAYINVPQAAGLATESFSGHVGQRTRWARGMAQIMRTNNPMLGRGLQFMQRLCYLNAMLHFFFALPRLIFLTAPLFYLYLGAYVINAPALTIAAYAVPHLVLATIANARVQGVHRHSFWNEVYEVALAPYIFLPTLLALVNPRLGKFNVTAKGGLVRLAYLDRRFARPFTILFLLNVGGLVAGAVRIWWMASPNMPTILMNVAWTLYNLVMLGVVLAVNWETLQLRRNVRLSVDFPARLHLSDGRVIETRTRDISEGGVGLQWSVTTDAPAIEVAAVELRVGAQSSFFPAARTLVAQGLLAVEFAPMNAATEGELVRIIYGRADAWLDWRDHEKPVGVWRSLVQIIRLGAIGLWRLGRGWRRADQQAV